MKFFFLLSIFYSSTVLSSWSPETRSLIEKESQKYKVSKLPGYTSLWGGIRRRFSSRDQKGERIKIKLSGLAEKELEIYYYKNPNSSKLHIFFPGVFGSLQSEITNSMIYNLEATGHSVLVIPNFFSIEYLKSKPIYGKKSFITDTLIPLKIIDRFKKNYQGFYLYGESLGSFIGASTLARLSKRDDFRNKFMSLTLLWPPLEIQNALENFDKNILKSKPMYEKCSLVLNFIKTVYYFSKEFYPQDVDRNFLECMDAFLYHSTFVKAMQSSFEEIKGSKDETNVGTFFEYLKRTRSDLYNDVKLNENHTRLMYWLNKRNKKNTEIRIISSQNDFLNLDLDWNVFLKDIEGTSDQLILLPWGSHSGPLGMPIWADVFKEIAK